MSTQRTKLQIEKIGFIDLFEDITIPITKSLSDIRDLSKRSGAFSTSIEVPDTDNNLQIFSNLYDINIINTTFDMTKKYRCIILKDDKQIFEGYIRLESINKYEGPDGNTLVSFNISLYDDVANFFMKIKDKYINTDDNVDKNNNIFWDDLRFDQYNYENIQQGFLNTNNDGWRFFLPNQTRGWYETLDFKPAVYAYEYVNRIISSVGYTWNGSSSKQQIMNQILTGNTIFISALTPSSVYSITNNSFINNDIQIGDSIIIGNTLNNNGTYIVTSGNSSGLTNTFQINGPITSTTETATTINILGKRFIDKEKWELLNKSTNFDKLIIPYAGPTDVFKSIISYDTTAGFNKLKYNKDSYIFAYSTTAVTYTNRYLELSPQISANSVGDILYIEPYNIGDFTSFYVQITKVNSISSTGTSYFECLLVDSDGYTLEDQGPTGFSLVGTAYITTYYNRKYFLNYNDAIYGATHNVINYTSVTHKLCLNNKSGKYTDTFNLLKDINTNKYAGLGTTYYSGSSNTRAELLYTDGPSILPNTYTGEVINTIYSAITSGEIQVSLSIPFKIKINSTADASLYMRPVIIPGGGPGPGQGSGGVPSGIRFDLSSFGVYFDLLVYRNDVLLQQYSKYGNNLIFKDYTSVKTFDDYKIKKGMNTIFDGTFKEVVNVPVVANDNIRIDVVVNGGFKYSNFVISGQPSNGVNTTLIYEPQNDYNIKIKTKGPYREDDTNCLIRDFIPKKIKQSDFILGLCRTMNLMVDYDNRNKRLLILPRDEYYGLGTLYDWSHKLDISNKNNVLFFPDLQYKNYIYTYKPDSDTYSKIYTNNIQKTYGQLELIYDNDFLNGTTTIENIFYSTPLVRAGGTKNIYNNDVNDPLKPGSGSAGIPKISANDGNIIPSIDYSQSTNLKLLYDGGNITEGKSVPFAFRIKSTYPLPTGNTYVFTQTIPADTTTGEPQYNIGWTLYDYKDKFNFNYYPYIGHFYPAPLQPKDDLNYGLNDYYFYPDIVVNTENNLFYKHYLRTIQQQNKGKLLKCKVYITPDEISKIQFYDTFYLFESLWHLNKIDYNENNSDLYEVEFISI